MSGKGSISVYRSETIKQDVITAKHVLQEHQKRVITGSDFQRINVRRSHLYQDAVRAFSRPTFNVSKLLKVVFVGEPSVDDGGPRREFYQLLMKEVFTLSGLFTGWPENVVPVHNVTAVASNKFYVIGKMITACLVHGGQPPVCFSRAVAEYLVYNEIKCEASLDDIPDHVIRQKLTKVGHAPGIINQFCNKHYCYQTGRNHGF